MEREGGGGGGDSTCTHHTTHRGTGQYTTHRGWGQYVHCPQGEWTVDVGPFSSPDELALSMAPQDHPPPDGPCGAVGDIGCSRRVLVSGVYHSLLCSPAQLGQKRPRV